MLVVERIEEVREIVAYWRSAGDQIGFVPTMGALHAGHMSLVQSARTRNQRVLVSIFVNPRQFAPGEDFDRYPRDTEGDVASLQAAQCDLVFLPQAAQIDPPGFLTSVEVTGLSQKLIGRYRPNYFSGVTTIVAKLMNIVMPDTIYFGQKDWQQSQIIRHMIRDLAIPIRLEVVPTVREGDGLAMSSRNRYLSDADRGYASAIYSGLRIAATMVLQGNVNASQILTTLEQHLRAQMPAVVEIKTLAFVDAESMDAVSTIVAGHVLLVEVKLSGTLLYDNWIVGKPL